MIFLGSGVRLYKEILKALERPADHTRNHELDIYFLVLGWGLVAIGVYFLYEWLMPSAPQGIHGSSSPAPTSTGHRKPAIVLLGLGAILILIGTRDDPPSNVNPPDASPAFIKSPEAPSSQVLDETGLASYSTGYAYILQRPAYPFPKLSESPYSTTWTDRIVMPKIAEDLPASATGPVLKSPYRRKVIITVSEDTDPQPNTPKARAAKPSGEGSASGADGTKIDGK